MTARLLAALHAEAMTGTPGPWAEDDFEVLLDGHGVFLVTSDETKGAAPRALRAVSGPVMHAIALGRVIVDQAELLTLAVHPTFRGSGLGADCLSAFEREAARRGATKAFLEVAADNHKALRLYTRAGYSRDGVRRGYYRMSAEHHVDAVLMSKSL